MTTWFYLSFADDGGWRGGCFIPLNVAPPEPDTPAHKAAFLTAIKMAKLMGCNPGGEVLASFGSDGPPEGYAYRLLTKADLEAAFGGVRKMEIPEGMHCAECKCERCKP